MHPKTRKILKRLRLRQKLTGVFLKANEATMRMLLSVDPYVAYGYGKKIALLLSLFTYIILDFIVD